MFSVGWQAVEMTTSAERTEGQAVRAGAGTRQELVRLPVWPCSFCTISFVWRFQMYTMLSSEPDTIHCRRRLYSVTCAQNNLTAAKPALTFPPVTEKLANMQYFSFLWPVYVFKHWRIQKRNDSMKWFRRLSNPTLFSKITHLPSLCCSPTTSACCKFSINVLTASNKTAKHNTHVQFELHYS